MSSFLVKALRPTPGGLAILLAAFLTLRQTLTKSTSWTKIALFLVFFVNRGALPLRWHAKLLYIALRARARFELAKLGLRRATIDQKKLGLRGGDLALAGVGRNVFDIVSVRHAHVGFAESDYNLHLSNSNYAQAGDFARMQFASDYTGASFTDGVLILLGATSFVYMREIPMFADYSTESRVVAYDDKWCYFLTRYVIPYSKSSKRPPSKSFATGKDVTVCAFLLSKLCFKRGRTNVTPEKMFTLSGMVGPEDIEKDAGRNWSKVVAIRKAKGIKAWIQSEDDAGQYIRGAKEKNDRALAIIARLTEADRGAWTELDAL